MRRDLAIAISNRWKKFVLLTAHPASAVVLNDQKFLHVSWTLTFVMNFLNYVQLRKKKFLTQI